MRTAADLVAKSAVAREQSPSSRAAPRPQAMKTELSRWTYQKSALCGYGMRACWKFKNSAVGPIRSIEA
jgi:hypothetical protein